jgi:hypothetical protein
MPRARLALPDKICCMIFFFLHFLDQCDLAGHWITAFEAQLKQKTLLVARLQPHDMLGHVGRDQ